MIDYVRDPAEITRQSFEIVAAEADLSSLPGDIAWIGARIVHACGMPDVIGELAFSPGAGTVGLTALRSDAPIVCDVRMVAAGLMAHRLPSDNVIHIAVDQPASASVAARLGQTRSAAGMDLLRGNLEGAVVVIGNAPTALFRLLELVAAGTPKPALVLGFPVGFVGAVESKEALAANDLGLPFITLHGRRGGSAIAAAAMNALILQSGSA